MFFHSDSYSFKIKNKVFLKWELRKKILEMVAHSHFISPKFMKFLETFCLPVFSIGGL